LNIKKILIDDLVLYTGGFKDFNNYFIEKLKSNFNTKFIIVHINLRNYYYLNKDEKLKEEIKKYCVCVLDGIGMKIGMMLKGYGMIPDLNGTDLFPLIIKEIITLKYGIFMLGADENTIEKAQNKVKEKYPDINLCGYHSGYFSESEEYSVIEKINNSKSNILIIGMGFPLQEKFVLRNIERIQVPVIWNVGGLFDFLSGSKPRAPLLIRKIRLEWLYRFALEPCRMLHRNTLVAFLSFLKIILSKRNYY
jgi:N-acetylglucosaminyldiphosphoundecaprenol N-acetyl-beta-D-mannosaminyltransferase